MIDQTITYPKVMPPAIMLGGVLLMLILHFVFPIVQIMPAFGRLIGLLPLGAGLALSFMAERQFIQVGTAVNPTGVTSQLVTDGIYRYTRNPMYLGLVLALLGVALLLGSLMPFGVIPLFLWWIGSQFIRREEAKLATQFGQDWLEYKTRARRWI